MYNPFQRDTQLLLEKQSVRDMNLLYQISLFTKQKKFNRAENSLNDLLDRIKLESLNNPNQEQQEEIQELTRELSFLKAFLRAIQNDTDFAKNVCKEVLQKGSDLENESISYEYFLKNLLLLICIKLRKKENITNKELQAIKKCLQLYPQGKNQVVLKLTGCKTYERLEDISFQQIDQLTDNPVKKAMKLQIASDWKYIINDKNAAIKMKSQAMKLWKQIDKLQKYQQCSQEQKQLTMIVSGQTIDTAYVRKLIFIRQIIQIIKPIKQNEQKKRKDVLRKASVKYILPVFLSKLKILEIPSKKSKSKNKSKSKEKEDLKSSMLKKSSLCQERKEIGKNFLKHVESSHYACVEFIAKNKFEANRQTDLKQSLGVLNSLISKRNREFFQRIKIKNDVKI